MSKEAFIHGIYPRSERLVKATQDADRGRITAHEVVDLQIVDRDALVAHQQSEGLRYIEDGKLPWQDLFRPFATTSHGFNHVQDGEVTRWFDNNTFYRKPVITGLLVPDFPKLDEFFPQVADSSRWKVTLPSPFTFAKLSEDKTTKKFDGTLENVTQFIKAVIEHLEIRGVSFIQLNELFIPYHDSQPADIEELVASLTSLDLKNRKAKLALHSYFGDCAPLVKRLEEEDVVDVLGVDFLKTRVEDLPTSLHHGLIAGVVNGRNSSIETATGLSPLVENITEHTRPTTLYVSHNADLEFLPEAVAREKITLIGGLR